MDNINSLPKEDEKNSKFFPKGDEKKYKMTPKSEKSVYLQAVTMIWVELVANQVAWLTQYSLPSTVIVDRGNEFLAKFREVITNDYSIMIQLITSKNPQANEILERVH